MTPSNHSPEAPKPRSCAWCDELAQGYASVEPGYPLNNFSCGEHGAGFVADRSLWTEWLAAHDAALVAATHAPQYATTRTELGMRLFLIEHLGDPNAIEVWPAFSETFRETFYAKADALLAIPGPLLDAAEVRREVVEWFSMYPSISLASAIFPAREHFAIEGAKP